MIIYRDTIIINHMSNRRNINHNLIFTSNTKFSNKSCITHQIYTTIKKKTVTRFVF